MKNYLSKDYFDLMKPLLRKMKITLLVFLIFSSSLYAINARSQVDKINIAFKNAPVKEVLDAIETQTDYLFVYDKEEINLDRKVNIHASNQPVDEVLLDILKNTNFTFKKLGTSIILMPDFGQQQKTVTGMVTDYDNVPLPGVTVLVKGTTKGTITNADGEFSLSNVEEDATLVFSFVGMKTQEILVAGKTSINVVLEEDAIGIEEVIAIGYGTMKRQEVTGAVAQAKMEPYEKVAVNNVLERIKGTVAGLNVGGTNTAGAVPSLVIRGQNSTAGNSPLVVVDGVIFSGSLADIAPNDIENFTVLKDASAAAVYGSRSANGVIIIDTKKGKGISGKPKFDVKMNYGVSDQLKPLEVYDAEGYIKRLLDIRQSRDLEADPDRIRFYLTEEEQKNYDATEDHRPTLEDPFSLVSQLGHTLNTTVSVSNSTEKTNYYISTSLIKQKGVVINDDFKHISARVNIDSDLTDWFNLGIKSFYSLKDYSGDSPGMYRATHFSPYASVYNEDGTYKQFPQTTTSFNSPFWEMATQDTDIRNNLTGVVSSVIKVPWVNGLSFHTTFSNSMRWNERGEFFDVNTIDGKGKNGIGRRRYTRNYNMLLDNFLKYNHAFTEDHRVDVTLLFSREHAAWENMTAYAEDFQNTTLGHYALEQGTTQTVDTGGGESDAIGMMARGTYTFKNRYSLTGTIRRDGYSAFSKNKKWGVFPSAGFNWNISREGFMENVDVINNLALRISYGKNGNQSINPYSTLARISSSEYVFYGDDSFTITQYISSLANNDLSWETTTGTNMGIDFILLDNRISGSVDGYMTKTNDLIFNLSLPGASGKSSINSNIGEIRNKGIELNLSTLNIDSENFKWYSDFAFSLNRNEVASILGKDDDGDGKEDDLVNDGYFIGESLGTIYGYKVIGMWQQEDADNGTIMTGLFPGDYKLEDIDGDGAMSQDKDRQIIGNSNPNFRWSWTNTLQYKNFSLMFYLYSIWGGNGWYLSGNNTPYLDAYSSVENINRPVYDYWTPTNTDAEFPAPYNGPTAYGGTKYIDRSFIKLQKVSLTYDASSMVKPWGINGLSFSLSADNIGTFAPYWSGLDPETNNGLKDNATPSIRTWLFSIALNF
ncbi:SusC/RagA family TonB-linked outer membrane protein [Maribellus maritimus]|uniref:SusC/RagA family TonB-linked outer membrane protein n=1 Tax=Maribellus maritimus TaxID=2870838 RepID=UPI001EEBFA91|nr:SusC/RagA family TonB-linked outer membrane protein [Maribellus maritimus]MCG6187593.1 SusC/RagA family TonB-linked outer membrane protein [Maribellus maritimus]